MVTAGLGDRSVPETRQDTLQALVEVIYPRTDWGPGARDLGLAEAVRSLVDSPMGRGEDSYRSAPFSDLDQPAHGWQWEATYLEAFDHGLDVVDAWAWALSGAGFGRLPPGDQIAAVHELEAGTLPGFSLVTARAFFALLSNLVFDALFVAPTMGSYSLDAVWHRLNIDSARLEGTT